MGTGDRGSETSPAAPFRKETQGIPASLPAFPLWVLPLLTSKDQQGAEEGKVHDPNTEQWSRLLEVPSGPAAPYIR